MNPFFSKFRRENTGNFYFFFFLELFFLVDIKQKQKRRSMARSRRRLRVTPTITSEYAKKLLQKYRGANMHQKSKLKGYEDHRQKHLKK